MYRKCITDGRRCARCGHDQPLHEYIGYCAVDHVRHVLPELALGGGPGLGWLHIVAAGRAFFNNGHRGGIEFVNNVLDHGWCW